MGKGAGSVPIRVVVHTARDSSHHPSGSHPGTKVPTTPSTGQLPFTGSPVDAMVTTAFVLLAIGGALVSVVRRNGAHE